MNSFCLRCGVPVPVGIEICWECEKQAAFEYDMDRLIERESLEQSFARDFDDGDYDAIEDEYED